MLVAENPTIDLGDIKFGQVYKFSFDVKNEGPNPITVDKVIVSCTSCTVASMPKRTIQPNQIEKVNVTFTPGSVSKQKKFVQLLYGKKNVTLKFIGDSHE